MNFIRELKKLNYFTGVLINYSRMNTVMNPNNDTTKTPTYEPDTTPAVAAVAVAIEEEVPAAVAPITLQTEDTGKIFEKAICDAYGIPYDGPFQYSQTDVDKLTPRLKRLVTDNLFPLCKHTASKGARYDFTALAAEEDGKVRHLSAKSNKKKGGKVAPQVVGQATPQKFWEEFLQFSNGSNESSSSPPVPDPATMKKYIQENITAIMPMLWRYTFDSPMVYYVRDTNQIRFIAPVIFAEASQPHWSSFQYSWSRHYDKWTNSTSLRVVVSPECGGGGGGGGGGKEETIMEFQFHTKSRQNMAIRWCIDKVLTLFAGHFKVTEL